MTWRERLVNGHHDDNVRLAGAWETCAVGEQHALHPEVVVLLSDTDMPVDQALRDAGMTFWKALTYKDTALAHVALDAIEDRVLQLKRGGDPVVTYTPQFGRQR